MQIKWERIVYFFSTLISTIDRVSLQLLIVWEIFRKIIFVFIFISFLLCKGRFLLLSLLFIYTWLSSNHKRIFKVNCLVTKAIYFWFLSRNAHFGRIYIALIVFRKREIFTICVTFEIQLLNCTLCDARIRNLTLLELRCQK